MPEAITTVKRACSDGRTSVKILITSEAGLLGIQPGDFVQITIKKLEVDE